jgi:hypothetical protein
LLKVSLYILQVVLFSNILVINLCKVLNTQFCIINFRDYIETHRSLYYHGSHNYCLRLYAWLFEMSCVRGMMLFLCDWLISLSIMSSRSTKVTKDFLSYSWIIFYCMYLPHYFVHYSINEHLASFLFLSIVNNPAMNMYGSEHISLTSSNEFFWIHSQKWYPTSYGTFVSNFLSFQAVLDVFI